MSTLRVDNFAPRAGGTSFGLSGIAKAEVLYDQATPTVDGSNNVTSVTDVSLGLYTVNLTNNMGDVVYRKTYGPSNSGTFASNASAISIYDASDATRTTSALQQRNFYANALVASLADGGSDNVVVHGDLA